MRHPFGRILTVILTMSAVLVLSAGPAFAAETIETEDVIDISFSLQEEDAPEYDPDAFFQSAYESYYLTLDGKLLAAGESEEALTSLIFSLAQRYVTGQTVSCTLEESPRLELCYGFVPASANTDLNAAANTLRQNLKFVTVVERSHTESLPYQEITVEDPEMYEDEDPIVTEGKSGSQVVVEVTTQVNGKETDTQVIKEVVEAPQDEVTTVGAKERPEYIWPASGRISSKFGPRNLAIGSKNHKGIDIACSHGSDILAAKAGEVIYASYNSGGYGYLVKLQHEDGDVTYYGHNSSLCVSVGDQVEQGDVIAKAGSTGRSSGTHCHFEIRVDGTPVDPMNYLD